MRVRGSGDAKTVRLMRHLGQGFYGRMQGYQEAVAQDSHQERERALAEMLVRTLFADSVDDDSIAESARRGGAGSFGVAEALRLRDVAEVWAGVLFDGGGAVYGWGETRSRGKVRARSRGKGKAKVRTGSCVRARICGFGCANRVYAEFLFFVWGAGLGSRLTRKRTRELTLRVRSFRTGLL